MGPKPDGNATVTGQLAFDLPSLQAFRREDFFVSPANAHALDAITDPANRCLLLVGPQGTGKTHLAHIWAAASGGTVLPLANLPRHLPRLAPDAAIAIDNADAPDRDETTLFHLYNLLATSGRLLLTATTPPRDWGVHLADLMSRLQSLPLVRLDAPDDALLSAVLIKLFADRQIVVLPNLIPYLVTRMERSIAAARTLVAGLDAAALAQGRPVTRTLAGAYFDAHAGRHFE
jgi:chromosomal replication initiation ATPase DnaA